MPKPEFKKIRTMTMTKTYVETLFEALKRLRDCKNTPEEKTKIEKLIKLIEHQTGFKVEQEPEGRS